MSIAAMVDVENDETMRVDPIEEIQLRTWARMNYAPAEERDEEMHPIILDEMVRKDREA